MKKFLTFMLAIMLICVNLTGCIGENYDDWQTIKVEDRYSFKIPPSWKKGEKNGLLYFCDKNEGDNICMIMSKSNPLLQGEWEIYDSSSEEAKGCKEKNVLGDFQGLVFSDHYKYHKKGMMQILYGQAVYSIDGYTYIDNYIKSASISEVLYSWQNRVDLKTMKKIAKSFEIYKI